MLARVATNPGDADDARGALQTARIGREGALREIAEVAAAREGERVVYAREGGVREWYEQGPTGLEQGFDLTGRPAGSGALVLELRTPGWSPVEVAAGATIVLRDRRGHAAFAYGHATTRDSDGRTLPTSVHARGGRIELRVEDAAATYPIVIDPIVFWNDQTVLLASDEAGDSEFGTSIAASDTAVVTGAPGAKLGAGAVYVFTGAGTAWSRTAEIPDPDGNTNDGFGSAVAFDGATIAVAALGAAGGSGAVYTFTRNGTAWQQTAELTDPDGAAGDAFGAGVAVSGTTIAIGAPFIFGPGSTYVFVASGTSWAQQTKLTGSCFASVWKGPSVALEGDTLALAACVSDEVDVYTRAAGVWTLQQALVSPDVTSDNGYYGSSLALSGDTLVIGDEGDLSSSGAAYVFARSGTTWTEKTKLSCPPTATYCRQFGTYVAALGTTIAIGDSSDATVYQTTDPTWTPHPVPDVGNAGGGDLAVAINSSAMFSGVQSGGVARSINVFSLPSTSLAFDATLVAAAAVPESEFGSAVALDGNTALIGAASASAAYIFARSGTAWTQQAELHAPETTASFFGSNVAVKGTVAFIGDGANAHVFNQSGTTWSESQLILGADSIGGFATDGDSLAVPRTTGIDVYEHTGSSWSVAASVPPPASAGTSFGQTLAIQGPNLVVAAPAIADGLYVFQRSGTTWDSGTQLIPSPDYGTSAQYGASIAIDGRWLAVAAPGAAGGNGIVYVFGQTGTTWAQQATLTGSANSFGKNVAISGSNLAVTSSQDVDFYGLLGTTWTHEAQRPTLAETSALALNGQTALVGEIYAHYFGGQTEVMVVAPTNTGAFCSVASDCTSGFCVDGYCCNSACTGPCQACSVTGSLGICAPVPAGSWPRGDRAACSTIGLGTGCGWACDGSDGSACHAARTSTACGTAGCASSTTFTAVGSCDGAGNCNQATQACAPYTCVGSACLTSCAHDSDCQPNNWCNAGACTSVYAQGAMCTSNDQCSTGACIAGICCNSPPSGCPTGEGCSFPGNLGTCLRDTGVQCTADTNCGTGFCADGYCCDSACGGTCQACDVPGSQGTCTVLGFGATPHGARAACAGAGVGKTCGPQCTGASDGNCHDPTSSTSCGLASCSDNSEIAIGACDGAGSCVQLTTACDGFACNAAGTACTTSCTFLTQGTDCASGHYCSGTTCVVDVGVGNACSTTVPCATGLYCTDGVCCGVASCGTGSACNATGHEGTCTKSNGITCAHDADCGSGHCADQVCCDQACAGQCEACIVTGHEGTCTPVVGAPLGGRAACDSLAATDCGKLRCDGSNTIACKGYANTTSTTCAPASCSGDTLIGVSTCSLGACNAPAPTSCLPYTCASGACVKSCAATIDCAQGFSCDIGSSKCVQGATCSDDRATSVARNGAVYQCSPYLCDPSGGNCANRCSLVTDCASGFTCDSSNSCVAQVAPSGAAGGCAMTVVARRGGGAGDAVTVLIFAGALVARRRRIGRPGSSAAVLVVRVAPVY
ncbi:MAG: FG-GAP repeat protein [Polyangiales bacterium]